MLFKTRFCFSKSEQPVGRNHTIIWTSQTLRYRERFFFMQQACSSHEKCGQNSGDFVDTPSFPMVAVGYLAELINFSRGFCRLELGQNIMDLALFHVQNHVPGAETGKLQHGRTVKVRLWKNGTHVESCSCHGESRMGGGVSGQQYHAVHSSRTLANTHKPTRI